MTPSRISAAAALVSFGSLTANLSHDHAVTTDVFLLVLFVGLALIFDRHGR